jgi:hypothetical protein
MTNLDRCSIGRPGCVPRQQGQRYIADSLGGVFGCSQEASLAVVERQEKCFDDETIA